MKKVGEKEEKELWRLWVEYLKRNDNCRGFSEWRTKQKKNPGIPCPEKFQSHEPKGDKIWILLRFFEQETYFGDIFAPDYDFEKWWESIGRYRNHSPKEGASQIEDYAEHIALDFDFCVDIFKKQIGREPTLQEIKDFLVQTLKGRFDNEKYLYLRVSTVGTDIESLTKLFEKKVRAKRRAAPGVMLEEILQNRFRKRWRSGSSLNLDELKKYLQFYDIVEALTGKKRGNVPTKTWEEAIRRFNPQDDPAGIRANPKNPNDPANVLRKYKEWYKKAQRIIECVEFGVFPGPYDNMNLSLPHPSRTLKR